MKKCKYCQSNIDVKAKVCPNCHKKQGNFFQKHPILTVFLVLILIGIITNTSGEGEPKKTGESKNTEVTYKIGDTIAFKEYEVTVENVTTTNQVGGEYFKSTPASGGIYVCVDIMYKNITDEPISGFDDPTIKLVDSKGTKYSNDISASAYYATEKDTDRKILSDLNPGISVTDNYVFEVSEESYNNSSWYLLIDGKAKIEVK